MKKTNIMPFSNGTEFMIWGSNNCGDCELYENTSTERSKARCKYAFDLDLAQGTGEIPIETLNFFGYKKYYHLGDCPTKHLDRLYSYEDLKKAKEKAEKNKINELPFE